MIRYFILTDGTQILADEMPVESEEAQLFYLVHNAIEVVSVIDRVTKDQKYIAKGFRNPFATSFPVVSHLQIFNVAEYYQDVDIETQQQYRAYIDKYMEARQEQTEEEEILSQLTNEEGELKLTDLLLKNWKPANTESH